MKSTDAAAVIALAKEQVGVREVPPGSNNVIYNTDYYGGPVSGAAYPWCCAFIWWLFWRLGISDEFCGGAKTAYCPYVVNYARNNGAWITNAAFEPGDLFLYDWDGDGVADHIGICVSWSGSSGVVIEGNCDDAVTQLTRPLRTIMGAYRPAYRNAAEKPADDATEPPALPYRPGDRYMVQPGDTLWGIAERFLGDGSRWHDLWEYNRLPSTVIRVGDVIVLPPPDWPGEAEDPAEKPKDAQPAGLPILASSDAGYAVESLQLLLMHAGHALPECGVDGEFGDETAAALRAFQTAHDLPVTGETSGSTWEQLIRG